MKVAGAETRQCPKEFQDRITRMFGRNQFGQPNFKIVWGQSTFIRLGNVWRDRWGNERKGFRDTYQCHGQPCWVIMRWKQPAHYGSPAGFYLNTYDDFSGLHFLGEYPWQGRYEIVVSLIRKEFTDNQLKVTHFPLSHVLIDKVIPLILKTQALSQQELQAARALAKAEEHRKDVAEMAEIMAANQPTYLGPVSYSRQGCRTSILDRKMEKIQKQWDALSRGGRRPNLARGFQIANRPLRLAR